MALLKNKIEELVSSGHEQSQIEIESIESKFKFKPDEQISIDSIDLRIDTKGYLIKNNVKYIDSLSKNLEEVFEEVFLPIKGFELLPGQVLFTNTIERITWNSILYYGELMGRSVYSKLGISVHFNQPKISGGYKNVIPLQIKNNTDVPIFIYPYQKLVQLMIHQYIGIHKHDIYKDINDEQAKSYPFPIIKDKEICYYSENMKLEIKREKQSNYYKTRKIENINSKIRKIINFYNLLETLQALIILPLAIFILTNFFIGDLEKYKIFSLVFISLLLVLVFTKSIIFYFIKEKTSTNNSEDDIK